MQHISEMELSLNHPPSPSIPHRSSETERLCESTERDVAAADCLACRGLGYVRLNVPVGDPDFGQLVPCDCQREALERRRFERLVEISGLLPEDLKLRFGDVIPRSNCPGTAEMLELARAFVAAPWGLLTFWGGYGNGKTLVLKAIVNEFRHQRGTWGVYVTFKDLVDHIRAGNEAGALEDARARYDRLMECPILAIDEADGARMTEYAKEFRQAFFNERYELAGYRRAHTVLAMNSDPMKLPGDIADRLNDGRFQIHYNGDDSMRPAMQW